MGKYTVIADVGTALVQLLRENLCPDIILSPDNIGLCSPDEKGDMILGLHLYDVRESQEMRATGMVDLSPGKQRFPSACLTLSYMITAYSKADVKHRAGEDQRILGRVIQTLGDNATLSTDTLTPVPRAEAMDLHIQMLALELEAQQRIWTVPNQAYRTSLFYRVGPVELESGKTRQVQRIVDLDLTVEEKERG
ncbi:MAG: DUF4255 domain-containing protein [Oscillospiraceae bacterium]